ncbi:MAG: hypothetical protein ISR48_11275 [Alphaproteobacteria bacterium]|nr:hypothetical protein [Alphaproteobacteria bacterium]
MVRRNTRGKGARISGEILFEFWQVGKHLKVTAVDPVTLTEVSMVADPAVGQETLQKMAMNKLFYVMKRNKERRRKKRSDLV